MKCLQCGKAAKETEVYQGIPIGTCEDGHRTGATPEAEVEQGWLEKAS
jgi:hypothetical protein